MKICPRKFCRLENSEDWQLRNATPNAIITWLEEFQVLDQKIVERQRQVFRFLDKPSLIKKLFRDDK